jgi:hypothetical protein
MLDAPGFGFTDLELNVALPAAFALVVCLLATFIAVRQVAQINPAEAMHAEAPQSGRAIWLEHLSVWHILSFNSRYAIKSALRNKGRFWAMVSGMVATVTLLVFSLGFRDSFHYMTTTYFEHVAAYDLTIQLTPLPHDQTPGFLNQSTSAFEKAWTAPAKISAGSHTQDLPLYVSAEPFATHRLTNEAGQTPTLGDGVVLPRFYADRLHVNKGDRVRVYLPNKLVDGSVVVADITDQSMNFAAITTYATAQKYLGMQQPMYNVAFVRTANSTTQQIKQIERQPEVLAVSSLSDEQASISRFTSLFNTYITSVRHKPAA